MEKEILTFEKIKKDLKEQQKDTCIGIAGLLVTSPLPIFLFITSINSGAVLAVAFTSLFVLFWVGMIGLFAIDIVTKSKVLKDKKHIVIDEVTGVEEKALDRAVYLRSEDGIITTRFRYIIHFSDFGEYSTPDRTLFDSCCCNDKFYLVLSKPHTGKILLAYNTKRYVLEGEDQNASL